MDMHMAAGNVPVTDGQGGVWELSEATDRAAGPAAVLYLARREYLGRRLDDEVPGGLTVRDVLAGRPVAWRYPDSDGVDTWAVDWPAVYASLAPGQDDDIAAAWVHAGRAAAGRTGNHWSVDLDVVEYRTGEVVTREASSWYTDGRVRPSGTRWVAAQGWAGSMREIGRYDSAAEAEAAVRAGLAAARAELAEALRGAGGPLAMLAPVVERLPDRVEVWATTGARLAEAEVFRGRDPVTLDEIARRLHVEEGTARKWRTRGVLPAADAVVYSRPVWWWSTISAWAVETGRVAP